MNAPPVTTDAIVLVEKFNNHSSTYTDAENLARHIISRLDSVAAKLKSIEDDIRRLWLEFDNLKDGETILGCSTKKEFCEKRLHRTPRAIQYLLAGGNPSNAKRSEIISSAEPAELPAQPTEAQPSYDEWLDIISQRILARDGADEDYTASPTEPLGWRTRNTVRVRITKFIHNLDDRYTFWHDLSEILWAHGWAGNTVVREGRREAWMFHWTDPRSQPDRSQEMPADWHPETDMTPRGKSYEPDEPEYEPDIPQPVEPAPKQDQTLEAVLDKLVERIVMEPYGYYAAKFKIYPQQHTTDLAMIEEAKLDIWQRIVEIGRAKTYRHCTTAGQCVSTQCLLGLSDVFDRSNLFGSIYEGL